MSGSVLDTALCPYLSLLCRYFVVTLSLLLATQNQSRLKTMQDTLLAGGHCRILLSRYYYKIRKHFKINFGDILQCPAAV